MTKNKSNQLKDLQKQLQNRGKNKEQAQAPQRTEVLGQVNKQAQTNKNNNNK